MSFPASWRPARWPGFWGNGQKAPLGFIWTPWGAFPLSGYSSGMVMPATWTAVTWLTSSSSWNWLVKEREV